MAQGIANIGNIKLWYETFGNPKDRPILLIMGAGSQGILWPDDFCRKLANDHFFVIRYDHRDTGLSTCVDYKEHPYTLNDLSNDALQLLDELNIVKAHLVGLSMGGHLVQLIAINHPERLLTATLMMSTPNHMVYMNALAGKDTPTSHLSKPKKQLLDFFSKAPDVTNNKEKIINYSLATWKLLNGPAEFDKTYWKNLITLHYNRIQNHLAQYNHANACLANPQDRTLLLKKVSAPTLVIHGSDDPALPIDHGKALAAAIPNAKLLIIKNMGHALNPQFHDEIIKSIITHARKGSQ